MKRQTVILIILGVILIVLLGYFYLNRDKSKRYDWGENYEPDNKQPYSTFVISELLKNRSSDHEFIEMRKPISRLLSSTVKNSNYVFIGAQLYYSQEDLDSLTKFVAAGNTAFISVRGLPEQFSDSVFCDSCPAPVIRYESDKEAKVTLSYPHSEKKESYTFYKKYHEDTINYGWNFINPKVCGPSSECKKDIRILGKIRKDSVSYAEIPYGKGKFLIHTVPIAFSNYHMLKKENLHYASKVFSKLPAGDIYWDERSRMYQNASAGDDEVSKTPLAYILSQPSLRNAWYLMLTLVLLYFVFYARRRLKVIPAAKENDNTSIEFAETIGRLYLSQSNHRQMIELKMKLFIEFLRTRYHFPLKEVNKSFIKKIADKTGVAIGQLEFIFNMYEKIQYEANVSSADLIKFHGAIAAFYNTCK